MCKSSSLIFVLLFAFAFRLEIFSWRLIGVITLIFVGVLLMVATQTQFILSGFIMVITFAFCVGDLDAAVSPSYSYAYIGTFYMATGNKAGSTVMACLIILMCLCSTISNVATASRQMFAFARDRGMPFSTFLCRCVLPESPTPPPRKVLTL